MALHKEYPEDFERIYRAWPKLPVGRTKKYEAYKKFLVCKKEFGFTDDDIDELVALIERMTRERKSWQKGSPYGPKGLQSWFEKRLFLDDAEGNYEKANQRNQDRYERANNNEFVETHEEAMRKIEAQAKLRVVK